MAEKWKSASIGYLDEEDAAAAYLTKMINNFFFSADAEEEEEDTNKISAPASESEFYTDIFDLIRRSFGIDMSDLEISKKMYSLQAKYESMASIVCEQKHLVSPHANMIFDPSENLWGNDQTGDEEYLAEAVSMLKHFDIFKDFDMAVALEALGRVDPGKAKLLDEKFKKKRMEVIKLKLEMMNLEAEMDRVLMERVNMFRRDGPELAKSCKLMLRAALWLRLWLWFTIHN